MTVLMRFALIVALVGMSSLDARACNPPAAFAYSAPTVSYAMPPVSYAAAPCQQALGYAAPLSYAVPQAGYATTYAAPGVGYAAPAYSTVGVSPYGAAFVNRFGYGFNTFGFNRGFYGAGFNTFNRGFVGGVGVPFRGAAVFAPGVNVVVGRGFRFR